MPFSRNQLKDAITNNQQAIKAAILILLITIGVHFLSPKLDDARSSMVTGGVLSGIGALAGFLATARSFLIIELHRHVYGTEKYQKRVRDTHGGDAMALSIMAPLHKLNERIGSCMHSCMLCIAAIWVAIIFGGEGAKVWLVDLALATILLVLFKLIVTIRSMNTNFHAIISEWEAQSQAALKEKILAAGKTPCEK